MSTEYRNDRSRASEPGFLDTTNSRRKPYRSPDLMEWGSIVEITKGPISGTEDFPIGGEGGTSET